MGRRGPQNDTLRVTENRLGWDGERKFRPGLRSRAVLGEAGVHAT